MSAVYACNGDDSIYDVTARYIHPNDRVTITFNVRDLTLQPVDGARITVLVNGIKDITWLKNLLTEKLNNIWDKIPELLKGPILHAIYEQIQTKIEEKPDIIDGLTITTWNYTDITGKCTFQLGKNIDYLFLIQHGNLKKPWLPAKHNTIRILKNPTNKTYNIFSLDISNIQTPHLPQKTPEGNQTFHLNYTTTSFQQHQNVRSDGIGTYHKQGTLDFFIVDTQNFHKYQNTKLFTCHEYTKKASLEKLISTTNQDWYLIFRNPSRTTTTTLTLTLTGSTNTNHDYVNIIQPTTTLFTHPYTIIGDKITIHGIASDNIILHINNYTIPINTHNNEWTTLWDTANYTTGNYTISATCKNTTDTCIISLIDALPPTLTIHTPQHNEIIMNNQLTATGTSSDNTQMHNIELTINNETTYLANGTTHWNANIPINNLTLGVHTLTITATDINNHKTTKTQQFIKNETGHTWKPQINTFYHTPTNPTNTSNILIYANVTSTSPYPIKHVILILKNNTTQQKMNFFHYATNPIQDRHEEDPLQNQTNQPIYGLELGQLPANQTIIYQIKAIDLANNAILSDEKQITIQ